VEVVEVFHVPDVRLFVGRLLEVGDHSSLFFGRQVHEHIAQFPCEVGAGQIDSSAAGEARFSASCDQESRQDEDDHANDDEPFGCTSASASASSRRSGAAACSASASTGGS